MKITVVKEYTLKNSTEPNKSTARARAIAAMLYVPPEPTKLEKLVKYYYKQKPIWINKLMFPYHYVKYQYKQLVLRIKKTFSLSFGPTFTVNRYVTEARYAKAAIGKENMYRIHRGAEALQKSNYLEDQPCKAGRYNKYP